MSAGAHRDLPFWLRHHGVESLPNGRREQITLNLVPARFALKRLEK